MGLHRPDGSGLPLPEPRTNILVSRLLGGMYITSDTTFYVTKNKGTSATRATIGEIHGQKPITNAVSGAPLKKTPGQAFTIEWGLGQVFD